MSIHEMNDVRFDKKGFIKAVWSIRNSWGGIASQQYISDHTGISQSTLSRIMNSDETGYKITMDHFIKLYNLMEKDVNLDAFIY